MRKQTKLVAVLSTAALLAIGASMTSFAATGWQEEDGTWVYYNRDEEKATESWKKSGDNWFWLDDNGEMATDTLVEDDDDTYYVDANGAMVRNQWVAIDNEDAGEEDEPDQNWYYFQANGKAYKTSSGLSKKTINGKKYAFDADGKMLYGWVDENGERQTGDDAWKLEADEYYFGDENDGAMSTGWRLISIVDDTANDAQPGDQYWDEDQDRWFYFSASGVKTRNKANEYDSEKKTYKSSAKKINGKKYGFDEYGRMIASWHTDDLLATISNTTDVKDIDKELAEDKKLSVQGRASYSNTFMYFSTPEDGARYTKGWFKVVPGYFLDSSKYEDDSEKWYYADGDGQIYAGVIEKINGKKYAFDEYGRMMSGLQLLDLDEDGKTIKDSDDFDDEDDFDSQVGITGGSVGAKIYYFGSSDDGSMKTGKQTVELDGEKLTFNFQTSSTEKGQGFNGVDKNKLYIGGKLIKADSDDKYIVVGFGNNKYQKFSIKDLKDKDVTGENDKEYKWTVKAGDFEASQLYVINSSGNITTKNNAKNGDDYKFQFGKNDEGKVVLKYITLEK